MPSIFSGLDAISSGSLSSQDQEKLNKLKTEVEKLYADTTISDEEYKEIKSYIFGSSN